MKGKWGRQTGICVVPASVLRCPYFKVEQTGFWILVALNFYLTTNLNIEGNALISPPCTVIFAISFVMSLQNSFSKLDHMQNFFSCLTPVPAYVIAQTSIIFISYDL